MSIDCDVPATVRNGHSMSIRAGRNALDPIGRSRRLIRFGFGTVTGERPMLRENQGTISKQDQPTCGDIFVSVEMSRSKWVVGIHTRLADKIALHTMAATTWKASPQSEVD